MTQQLDVVWAIWGSFRSAEHRLAQPVHWIAVGFAVAPRSNLPRCFAGKARILPLRTRTPAIHMQKAPPAAWETTHRLKLLLRQRPYLPVIKPSEPGCRFRFRLGHLFLALGRDVPLAENRAPPVDPGRRRTCQIWAACRKFSRNAKAQPQFQEDPHKKMLPPKLHPSGPVA